MRYDEKSSLLLDSDDTFQQEPQSPKFAHNSHQDDYLARSDQDTTPMQQNHKVEVLSENKRQGSIFSSTVNVVNAIIGGGVLALPYAFSQTGLVVGAVLLVLIGVMSFLTSHYLASLTKYCMRRDGRSYKSIAARAFGLPGAFTIDVCFILFLFGGCVGYVVIIGDILTPYFEDALDWPEKEANRYLVESIFIFGICYPLCLLKRIDALKYTSMFALLGILYLVVVIMAQSITTIADEFEQSRIVFGNGSISLFGAVPVMTFAFTFHMQQFSVQNEMKHPNRIRTVVGGAISFAGASYMIVGIFGYLTFYENVSSNILVDYDEDVPIIIGKVALAFVIIFSFPLLHFPLREAVIALVFPSPGTRDSCYNWWPHKCQPRFRRAIPQIPTVFGTSTDDDTPASDRIPFLDDRSYGSYPSGSEPYISESDDDDEFGANRFAKSAANLYQSGGNGAPDRIIHHDEREESQDGVFLDNLSPSDETKLPWDELIRRVGTTTVMVILIYLLSIIIPNINAIFGLVGATVGSALVFIFPSILVIKLEPEPFLSFKKLLATIMIVAGFFFGIVGTYETIVTWGDD
eukprot:CAMPEP_0201553158 /NCGR_PEP_ID=MMETSP0173_2-20130828/19476_1 /ASSEMBLY_ACC=CAM_ASM_000268 /TAXON_ID=218659 /ORGANISM="Vexillifera sp., Strain DIVA3 564/2" /LENGTH=575 /DNA_ID=CAMNT_0047963777 /DNA_START=28 /DNA_END=1755 /DNA_ORIENTATION=+